MNTYKLPFFGEIELTPLKDYYSTSAQDNQREIEFDINFTNGSVEDHTLNVIKQFLNNIDLFDKENRNQWIRDFNEEGETSEYIEFYFEELQEEELDDLVDVSKNIEDQKLELLNKLELKRVGLYPHKEQEIGYFGIFDYSIKIEGEYCNQLLVVNIQSNGDFDHITWES